MRLDHPLIAAYGAFVTGCASVPRNRSDIATNTLYGDRNGVLVPMGGTADAIFERTPCWLFAA